MPGTTRIGAMNTALVIIGGQITGEVVMNLMKSANSAFWLNQPTAGSNEDNADGAPKIGIPRGIKGTCGYEAADGKSDDRQKPNPRASLGETMTRRPRRKPQPGFQGKGGACRHPR